MNKQSQSAKHALLEKDLAEFEVAATRLEQGLDDRGVTEQDLLEAAAQVRARMLVEVYGLELAETVRK